MKSLPRLVSFQLLYKSENFNLIFHKRQHGKKLATLKGKEKTLQVIFYHIWLQRIFYEIRRHKPCVEFNFLEESLRLRFAVWRIPRILKCFYDDGKEHEYLKLIYDICK